MRQIKRIVVHCSASRTDAKAKDLIAYHLTPKKNSKSGASGPYIPRVQGGLGWKTGGYHYIIEYDGNIVQTYDESVVTNGVKGYNANSIHICLVGGREGKSNFSPQQWDSLQRVLYDTSSRYNVPVMGHRDLSPDLDGDGIIEPHEWVKLCPCFDVSSWLKSINFYGDKNK